MKKLLTLCIIHQHPRILLGLKKRGFGTGRWNGFGGKVQEGESVEDAARREIFEEVGIKPLDMKKVGILDFGFENDPKTLEVHVFRAENFEGEPVESEEMTPKWFHVDEIPFHQMWSDDIFWMPLLLKGKLFKGKFLFDRPSDPEHAGKIIEHELAQFEEI